MPLAVCGYIAFESFGIFANKLAAVNALILLWYSTWSVGMLLLAFFLLDYLARVARPGNLLAAMGAHHVKISQRAATT